MMEVSSMLTSTGPSNHIGTKDLYTDRFFTTVHPEWIVSNVSGFIDKSSNDAKPLDIFMTVYGTVLNVLILVFNCIIIFVIFHLNWKRFRPSHLVLLNLTISNLLVGSLYLPLLLTLVVNHKTPFCKWVCTSLLVLEKGLITLLVWSVAFVSLDRYLYIVKHSRYKSLMTYKNCVKGLSFVWCVGLCFGVSSYFTSDHTVHSSGQCSCHITMALYGIIQLLFSAAYITLSFILPTTFILIFYGFIIKLARERVLQWRKNPFTQVKKADTRLSPIQHGRAIVSHDEFRVKCSNCPVKLFRVRAARMLFLVIVLHLCCFTPYFILTIAITMGHWHPAHAPRDYYHGFLLLLHTNSILSPIFYGYTNRKLRMSLKSYCRKKLGIDRNEIDTEIKLTRKKSNSKLSIMGEDSSNSNQGSNDGQIPGGSRSPVRSVNLSTEDMNQLYAQSQEELLHLGSGMLSQDDSSSFTGLHNIYVSGAENTGYLSDTSLLETIDSDLDAKGQSHKLQRVHSNELTTPRQSKRSLALKQITEVAMMCSVQSHSPDLDILGIHSPDYLDSGCSSRSLTPRGPTQAW